MDRHAVRTAREKLGLSRAELAAELGVVERTVLGWEYGERTIPSPTERLLKLLLSQAKPTKRQPHP